MMHTINKVEYLDEFKLLLTFNDKKTKVVDLKKYSKEGPETVFYPFRDLEFFKSVKVDKHSGTIVWPNGVDLCPDVLYKIGKEIQEQENPKKPLARRRKQNTVRSVRIKASAMTKKRPKKF